MINIPDYDTDSSSSNDESGDEDEQPKLEENLHLKPASNTITASKMRALVVAAPHVQPNESLDSRQLVDPDAKELKYNPKYEDLYAPTLGPGNPFKTQQESAEKNILSGFVEPAHVNDFQFELQRKEFHVRGEAYDPSVGTGLGEGTSLVTNETTLKNKELKDVFSNFHNPRQNRKRIKNDDPTDLEGFLGPWGKFVDEETVSKPAEDDTEFLEDYLMKMKKRAKRGGEEEKPLEEKSQLHIQDPTDYQGRSFLHIPQDVGINLKNDCPPEKCFIPKRQIHTWEGHSKGINVIKWFPGSGHLLMSGANDSKIKLWEVYKKRRCVRTYLGHKQAIKDVDFNNNGTQFLSTSYDRYIKLWDTETGECVNRFTNKKVGHCVKFNPDDDKQHMFLVGTGEKKIVQWDIRSGEIVQEYDRHMGIIKSITFVDENRRFVTTSDDKSMRVWEWEIPVDMKYIADPAMHSLPCVVKSPNQKWLACQSLDNKIAIYTCGERFRLHAKKEFKGHMVAGYGCGLAFSPEMSYLLSGDGDGKAYIWDWKTTKLKSKWKAHDQPVIGVLWHPHETSKVVTAGWDGLIKYWD